MELRRTVELADVAVGLAIGAPGLWPLLDLHFGRLSEATGAASLHVVVTTRPHPRPQDVATWQDGPVSHWQGGTQVVLCHDLGGAAVVADGVLTVHLDVPEDERWRVLRHLLLSALPHLLASESLMVLHAAFVARDGVGILVTGPTGSGKSTVALAAAHSGWDLLSDDLLLIDVVDGRARAFGVPKPVAVDPGTASHLGYTGCPPVPGDERGRVLLPPEILVVGWRDLSAIVAVSHDDGPGRVDPLPLEQVLRVVAGASVHEPVPTALRAQLPRIAAMVAVPAWTLRLGCDPEDRVARAVDHLAHVAGASSTPRVQ